MTRYADGSRSASCMWASPLVWLAWTIDVLGRAWDRVSGERDEKKRPMEGYEER